MDITSTLAVEGAERQPLKIFTDGAHRLLLPLAIDLSENLGIADVFH